MKDIYDDMGELWMRHKATIDMYGAERIFENALHKE